MSTQPNDAIDILLLAETDPNSPYFLRAMSELRAAQMQKECDEKRIERIVTALLNDKDYERSLFIQEQLLQHQKELDLKYREAWNANQQEEHQRAINDLNLAQEQLGNHLNTLISKLKQEVDNLTNQLNDLEKNQEKIKEDWAKNQKDFGDKYADKLKTGGKDGAPMSIVSANGESKELNEKQIERLQEASKQPDTLDLIKINPSLAVMNEKDADSQANRMAPFARVMQEIKQLNALKEIMEEMGMEKKEISGKQLLNILKKNEHIMKALNDVHKENPAIAKEARDTVKKALVTNEPFINAQIESKKQQMENNSNKAESTLSSSQNKKSTTPQFKPKGSDMGKMGG